MKFAIAQARYMTTNVRELKEDGWKSFKVYHIGQKKLSPCCNPFLAYILIPIKNNEWKVVKYFNIYFKPLQF
jgi:hypothetical protein